MAACKYIHPIDENTVIEIYGTTWKFCQKCVWSIAGKSGLYNFSHTNYEPFSYYPEADPPQCQSDDTATQ